MAVLKAPVGGTGLQIETLAPTGQHCGVCLRINDQFGVERPGFNNPQVKELKDVTRFVFGFIGQDRKPYLVQTYEFTISGAPGANLGKFLKGWLGQAALMGWDYCEMLGKAALLTVAHTPSKKNPGQIYADISGIAPMPPQMLGYVPSAQIFEPMLQALDRDAAAKSGTPPQAGAPAPLPPQTPPPAFQQPAYQPPVQQSFAPPPPPLAAPVPPPARMAFVHVNGATQKAPDSALSQFPANSHAMWEGESAWRTIADLIGAPKQPGNNINMTPTGSEDVPF